MYALDTHPPGESWGWFRNDYDDACITIPTYLLTGPNKSIAADNYFNNALNNAIESLYNALNNYYTANPNNGLLIYPTGPFADKYFHNSLMNNLSPSGYYNITQGLNGTSFSNPNDCKGIPLSYAHIVR